jgi:hypothetical protein
MIDAARTFALHMMLQLPLVAHNVIPSKNRVVILSKHPLRRVDVCHPAQAFFALALSS